MHKNLTWNEDKIFMQTAVQSCLKCQSKTCPELSQVQIRLDGMEERREEDIKGLGCCLPLSPQLLGKKQSLEERSSLDLVLLFVVALCSFVLQPPRCWGPAAAGSEP